MMIASVLAALGIVQMSFLLGQSVYRYVTWTQQTALVQAQETQLKQDVQILQDAKDKASDPTYLNALARCLGYVGQQRAGGVGRQRQRIAVGQLQPGAPALIFGGHPPPMACPQ